MNEIEKSLIEKTQLLQCQAHRLIVLMERMERLQEIYSDAGVEFEDIIENINIQGEQREEEEGEGYFAEAELNEGNEEFLDDYDEEQEMEFNE